MNQNRTSMSSSEYIIETARRTRVVWLGNLNVHNGFLTPINMDRLEGIFHITNTIAYKYLISTNKDWTEFISNSYSTSCTQCGNEGWKAINGRKQSIEEWLKGEIKKSSVQHDPDKKTYAFKLDKSRFVDDTIITAYDICKMKRLVVDGIHRAAALTMTCKERAPIPSVTIVECSGKELNVIFPCDIHQLP